MIHVFALHCTICHPLRRIASGVKHRAKREMVRSREMCMVHVCTVGFVTHCIFQEMGQRRQTQRRADMYYGNKGNQKRKEELEHNRVVSRCKFTATTE
jgi:hypothetical protein